MLLKKILSKMMINLLKSRLSIIISFLIKLVKILLTELLKIWKDFMISMEIIFLIAIIYQKMMLVLMIKSKLFLLLLILTMTKCMRILMVFADLKKYKTSMTLLKNLNKSPVARI